MKQCKKCGSADLKKLANKGKNSSRYLCQNCGFVNHTSFFKFSFKKFLLSFKRPAAEKTEDSNFSDATASPQSLLAGLFYIFLIITIISLLNYAVSDSTKLYIFLLLIFSSVLSIFPILYVIAIKNAWQDKLSMFERCSIGFGKRLFKISLWVFFGFISLAITAFSLVAIPAFTISLFQKPSTKCMTYLGYTGEVKNTAGRKGLSVNRRIKAFEFEGQKVELYQTALDYNRIKVGSKICFEHYQLVNVYANDRLSD